MTAKEFEELVLNGHNYPTWAMDVKISLASRGIARAIQDPETPLPVGTTPLTEQQNYATLYIIRHHIHPDLKSEYLEEESPSTLFLALKTRYEQQKAVVLPEALHDWTHLRLQDFKSISEYNHKVHKISSKLRFCGKEPTDAEKIEKTLSTMLPSDRILQQQYRARNYTVYSELIHMLLQAEKHDELLAKNGSQRPVGAQPLPEVLMNVANRQKFDGAFRGNQSNFQNKRKRIRNRRSRNSDKGKGTAKPKHDKSLLCNKCGCYTHPTDKCKIPKHLVMLYQQSQGRKAPQGKRFEANFNLHPDSANGAGSSHDVPPEPSNTIEFHQPEDLADTENMMIEYTSNDTFGDFD
ncbi:uncharacterized protein [Aegilops tauschii subsp. strangulata]|uniref:uncharacterized protein n=1 Tax=Aegilops tauschii subsp. strangulata TaxID=200361 RepID=UPI00098B93A5|nr:uncharacterized protein LOC109758550 [Aegilops tauschii subsp. strangulata]